MISCQVEVKEFHSVNHYTSWVPHFITTSSEWRSSKQVPLSPEWHTWWPEGTFHSFFTTWKADCTQPMVPSYHYIAQGCVARGREIPSHFPIGRKVEERHGVVTFSSSPEFFKFGFVQEKSTTAGDQLETVAEDFFWPCFHALKCILMNRRWKEILRICLNPSPFLLLMCFYSSAYPSINPSRYFQLAVREQLTAPGQQRSCLLSCEPCRAASCRCCVLHSAFLISSSLPESIASCMQIYTFVLSFPPPFFFSLELITASRGPISVLPIIFTEERLDEIYSK